MEISTEKTKLMTNRGSGIKREILIKGQKLGTVKAQNWRFSQGLNKPLQL